VKKKVVFTILWMVIFKLVFFLISAWILAMLDQSESHKTGPRGDRPSDSLMILFMIWVGIFKLSPIIALVLSIFGLLPGTKIKVVQEGKL
jgi:hypothetical protein